MSILPVVEEQFGVFLEHLSTGETMHFVRELLTAYDLP